MRYSGIHVLDIANGEGCRVSVFVSGCRNHCKGCFQPETWDFNYGTPFTEKTVKQIISELEPDYVAGLTVLGGDPCEPENQPEVYNLLKIVRDTYGDSKSIWVYTGYEYEEVANVKFLKFVDVLVDGPFEEENKVLGQFRGSSNQRFIDVQASLKAGHVVISEEYK